MAKQNTPEAVNEAPEVATPEETLEEKVARLEQEKEALSEQVLELNQQLSEAEKPSFEAIKLAYQAKNLHVVKHRGVVKTTKFGSIEGKPIYDLTDEELDALAELDDSFLTEIPE